MYYWRVVRGWKGCTRCYPRPAPRLGVGLRTVQARASLTRPTKHRTRSHSTLANTHRFRDRQFDTASGTSGALHAHSQHLPLAPPNREAATLLADSIWGRHMRRVLVDNPEQHRLIICLVQETDRHQTQFPMPQRQRSMTHCVRQLLATHSVM